MNFKLFTVPPYITNSHKLGRGGSEGKKTTKFGPSSTATDADADALLSWDSGLPVNPGAPVRVEVLVRMTGQWQGFRRSENPNQKR